MGGNLLHGLATRNLKTYLEALKETFELTPELDEYIHLRLKHADQTPPQLERATRFRR